MWLTAGVTKKYEPDLFLYLLWIFMSELWFNYFHFQSNKFTFEEIWESMVACDIRSHALQRPDDRQFSCWRLHELVFMPPSVQGISFVYKISYSSLTQMSCETGIFLQEACDFTCNTLYTWYSFLYTLIFSVVYLKDKTGGDFKTTLN